jgi:hypothetical protein
MEHAEDMAILAYLLLNDSGQANTVVENILMRLWEEDSFLNLDTSGLYNQVRQACQGYY